jgi:putative transposase
MIVICQEVAVEATSRVKHDLSPKKRFRSNVSLPPARLNLVFTCKRTRHTPKEIICKLKTPDKLIAQVQNTAEACRVLEPSWLTYHRWRQVHVGMNAEEAKRLSQMEKKPPGLKGFWQKQSSTRRSSKSFPSKTASPARRLRVVSVLQELCRASVRRLCQLVRQHRSTYFIAAQSSSLTSQVEASSLRDFYRAHPLGPVDGPPPTSAGRLDGEPLRVHRLRRV